MKAKRKADARKKGSQGWRESGVGVRRAHRRGGVDGGECDFSANSHARTKNKVKENTQKERWRQRERERVTVTLSGR